MRSFAFILSTAKLFAIPLVSFDMCKDQERVILGGEQATLSIIRQRFNQFAQAGRPAQEMLRVSECKITCHDQRYPETDSVDDARAGIIFVEDIMTRIESAVSSANKVFGHLIEYYEL
jgi:hypothetical protein